MALARKAMLAALGAAAAAAAYRGKRLVDIGAAYKAKMLCAGVFVSRRDPEAVLASDLAGEGMQLLRYFDARVDYAARAVTADVLGFARRRAVFREDRGCILVPADMAALAAPAAPADAAPSRADDLVTADGTLPPFDHGRLQAALEWAFAEPEGGPSRHTRAVALVHQGRLIGERYAPGFGPDTPLLGWSLTKSVVNALVGSAVQAGRAALDAPLPVAQWQRRGDPRAAITLRHLLQMSSGLRFDEDYGNPLADVGFMLFCAPDAAAYAAAKGLRALPGRRWEYSSGTTNIITRALRGIVGEGAYASYPRTALFDRLGMASAVLDTDATGTFLGSSFMYATARDWARFGLLYLQDGVWGGRRLLPEGWVRFSRTPAPAAPAGEYGGHFWLRLSEEHRRTPGVPPPPPDAFHAVGHEGQYLSIIPSRELVVVRLGLTRQTGAWDHHLFLHKVLQALPGRTGL